jgi:hypothetical protein
MRRKGNTMITAPQIADATEPPTPPSPITAEDRAAVCADYFGPDANLLVDVRRWRETGEVGEADELQRLERLALSRALMRRGEAFGAQVAGVLMPAETAAHGSTLTALVAKWRDRGLERCANELEAALRQQASAPGQAFQVTERAQEAVAEILRSWGSMHANPEGTSRIVQAVLQHAPRGADSGYTLEDRIKEVCDEQCGLQPVIPADEALTLIERHMYEQRKLICELRQQIESGAAMAFQVTAEEMATLNGVGMTYERAFTEAQKLHTEACKRYAEQIRNLEKRAQKAEDQAGKARCERDEARAKARTLNDAYAELETERDGLKVELAACRAKLEGLREACTLEPQVADALSSTMQQWPPHVYTLALQRIQAALQATQAEKPASAGPQRFVHESGCMQPDEHDCACPSPAKLPEPPRHNAFGDSQADFFAQQEMLAQKALLRHPGGAEKAPEDASAEKPSLEERVGRVERALLAFCDADSLEARVVLRKALDGAGKGRE